MSPARIPEGSVFVARQSGVNVALQLLEAAEQVGADRLLSVRTTTGGYHVFKEVAEQYQANLGEELENNEKDESDEDESDKSNEELEPLPVTAENTRGEIDEYGAKLDPPVDTTKAANKADAIALLEAARAPKTPDAE